MKLLDRIYKKLFLSADLPEKITKAINNLTLGNASCITLELEGLNRHELKLYRQISGAYRYRAGFRHIPEWYHYTPGRQYDIRISRMKEFKREIVERFEYYQYSSLKKGAISAR